MTPAWKLALRVAAGNPIAETVRAEYPRGTWGRTIAEAAMRGEAIKHLRASRAAAQAGACVRLPDERRCAWAQRRIQELVYERARGGSDVHAVDVRLAGPGGPGVTSSVRDDEARIHNLRAYRYVQWGSTPQSAEHVIRVPRTWRVQVHARELAVLPIDGHVVTLAAWQVPPDLVGGAEVYRVTYAAQTRGYALTTREAWYCPARSHVASTHGARSLSRLLGAHLAGVEAGCRWVLGLDVDATTTWRHLPTIVSIVQRYGTPAAEASLARGALAIAQHREIPRSRWGFRALPAPWRTLLRDGAEAVRRAAAERDQVLYWTVVTNALAVAGLDAGVRS